MKPHILSRHRGQAGYTLIELIIASAIGLLVLSALASIFVTTMLGANSATGRVEASAQIRNFQLMAYDDFALSRPPSASGCGTNSNPCTTAAMVLTGNRMPNQADGVAAPFSVTYVWNEGRQTVTRLIGAAAQTAASNVTDYSWYVDISEDHPVVVVRMTVTVGFYNTSYSESQSLLFYPRVTWP